MCGQEHVPTTKPRLLCELGYPVAQADREPMVTVGVSTCRAQRSSEDDAALFLVIAGELDCYSTELVSDPILDLVAEGRDVVADLAAVEFIDLAGLGLVEAIRDQVTERDGRVWLHATSRGVRRLVEIVDLPGVSRCSHDHEEFGRLATPSTRAS